ncbi:MAG: hypothetical protein ACP5FH_04630 [Terracidiphilus sp.]
MIHAHEIFCKILIYNVLLQISWPFLLGRSSGERSIPMAVGKRGSALERHRAALTENAQKKFFGRNVTFFAISHLYKQQAEASPKHHPPRKVSIPS